MGIAFDYAPERPEHIEHILNSLDRYNPETTTVLQDYVAQQCENQMYDCYANLALLKLYQFNLHLTRDETITSILVKALTVFPAPDFCLCLHLLPPSILSPSFPSSSSPSTTRSQHHPPSPSPLASAVRALSHLNTLLQDSDFPSFWAALASSPLLTDLVSDVSGFEELMRVRIAVTVSQAVRGVDRGILESWLNLKGAAFERFVGEVCGWRVRGAEVVVPINKENEAKGTVVRETVKFEQFSRLIRRAYEQPA